MVNHNISSIMALLPIVNVDEEEEDYSHLDKSGTSFYLSHFCS